MAAVAAFMALAIPSLFDATFVEEQAFESELLLSEGVALILIDASEGITDQDISVAGYAYDRGCGCIFLLNKWDLVEKNHRTVKAYTERLHMEAKFLTFAPVMTISALTGQRLQRIFQLVKEVYEQYAARIPTGRVNRILEQAMKDNEPSLHRGRRIKFYYATQASSQPPTFILFVNYPEAVHFSYKRYLVNQIRKENGLDMTALPPMVIAVQGEEVQFARSLDELLPGLGGISWN